MIDSSIDWLGTLVADIGAIRSGAADERTIVNAVAERISACYEAGHLPDRFRAAPAHGYAQHLLYVAPDRSFSIVALAWRPGAKTPIHDHGGWCAVAVYEGAECETRYRVACDESGPHLVEAGTQFLRPGRSVALLPDGSDVHCVSNCSDSLTVSLHVYGLDVAARGSSIASRYDAMPVRSAAPMPTSSR